jgi:hypothetical protein
LAYIDGRTQESSCYVANEVNLAELRRMFPGQKIAKFRAQIVRDAQCVIERKPDECPLDFRGDRREHVVIGPARELSRGPYFKRAEEIAHTPGIEILPPV